MPDDVETGFTRASTLDGDKPKKKAAPKKAAPKKRARTPTPEPVDVPSLDDVVLSASAQKDLEHNHQNSSSRTIKCVGEAQKGT